MSKLAEGLFELQRLAQQECGALTEHLLRAVAANLIGAGSCRLSPDPALPSVARQI
ncbi:hypothetical protein [Burkholderia stagnalis]|uniref:hypothetical protein n=1 Tax=Burkholderia stagnalis TaxID=1503054 RepID=UPI001627FC56|nr:hypothetical protein [Burkholderia stagnalis]